MKLRNCLEKIVSGVVVLLAGHYGLAQTCEEANNAQLQWFQSQCTAIACPAEGSAYGPVRTGIKTTGVSTEVICYRMGCTDSSLEYIHTSVILPRCSGAAMPLAIAEAKTKKNPRTVCGSIIQLENQTLGESVPLTGVDFSLNYFSNYVPGRRGDYKISVPLSNDNIRDTVASFLIKVKRDGQVVDEVTILNNQTHLSYSYVWNGIDGSGNTVIGSKRFTVEVTENRGSVTLGPLISTVDLGHFDARVLGLGGWVPSIFHFLDVNSKQLYSGRGEVSDVEPKLTTAGERYVVDNERGVIYFFASNGFISAIKSLLTQGTLFGFNYDSQGRLLSISQPFSRTTTFNRNIFGKLTGITSPKGQLTTITLNADGYVAAVVNALSQSYTMTYWSAEGLLKTFQKPLGSLSQFDYDLNGNLIKDSHSGGYFLDLVRTLNTKSVHEVSTGSPMGRAESYRTNYSDYQQTTLRNYAGGRIAQDTVNKTMTSYSRALWEDGVSTSLGYQEDPRFGSGVWFLNFLNSSHELGSKSVSISKTVTLNNPADPFSLASQVTTMQAGLSTITYTYSAANSTVTKSTGLGRSEVVDLDSLERVTSVQRGNLLPRTYSYTNDQLTSWVQGGRSWQLVYNSGTGFLQSFKNPLNQTTTFNFDVVGRLLSVALPDLRQIQYSYNSNGQLVSVTPPGRPAHGFGYNTHELLNEYTPSLLGGVGVVLTTYSYNADKQLTSVIRPDGKTINFNYSSTSGALTSYTTSEGTFYRNINTTNGEPYSIIDPDGNSVTLEYMGKEIIGVTNYDPSYNVLGSYRKTFDSNGLVVSDLVQGSSSVLFGYNVDEDLTSAGAMSLTYNTPNGQLTGTTLGTGATGFTDTYTYNSYGEVTSYTAKRGTSTLYYQSLTRDGMGRISGKSHSMNGVTNAYVYTFDSVGRLTQTTKNAAVSATYAYDSNSNRNGGIIGTQGTTATYDDQDRLLTYNTLSFTYNANGDLLTKTNNTLSQTTQYVYDVFGNLKKVTLPTGTVIDYEIDGLNRRIGKKVNGVLQKRWVYMDQHRIAAELNASGAITKRFVYGSKGNIPDYMTVAGVNYRIISDHLGSLRLVVRQSDGGVVQRMDHDEYGRVIADTNPGYLPFGFAGGLYDNQTGLVRFGARDYDPEIGRWTSKDPILFNGGDTNLYGYTFNDPVNFIDPTGLDSRCMDGDLCGAPIGGTPGSGGGGGSGTIPSGSTVYVSPNGQAAIAPRGSVVTTANNGAGLKITPPGSQCGGNVTRLMEPNGMSPNGYGTMQNGAGQYTNGVGNAVNSTSPAAHIQPTSPWKWW